MQQLGKGAVPGRCVDRGGPRDELRALYLDSVEDNGSATGGALAQRIPVIDDLNTRVVGGQEDDVLPVRQSSHLFGVVQAGEHGDDVGEQRTGAVVLGAIDTETAVNRTQSCRDIGRCGTAALGLGIGDPGALEHLPEIGSALFLRPAETKQVHVDEVAVRDLGNVGISCGQDPDDVGDSAGRQIGATVCAGDGQG